MKKLRPYASYRDSGVPWIGKIPETWKTYPIRAVAVLRNGATPDSKNQDYWNGDIAWFTPSDLEFDAVTKLTQPQRYISAAGYKSCATNLSPPGSVIVSTRAPVGNIGITTTESTTNQGCRTLTPKGGITPAFLASALMAARDELNIRSNGTTFFELSTDSIKSIKLPIPSQEEIALISSFLDRETARIDTLIAKKTRFIELLKEKILARIVASTSPRCEWDEFPFWRIARTKSISGRSDENLLSVYLDRGVIPYSEGGGLVHKPADSLEKYQLVEPGDLVMNNQQAWRGSLGVSPHRGIVSPAYLVFSLDKEKIDPSFANYAFRSGPYVEKFMLASMSVGDIQRQLKWPHLRKTNVSVPSLGEQRKIASELDLESKRISSLISKTERSIELLKEHRSALITAAVTGKIDVREAA